MDTIEENKQFQMGIVGEPIIKSSTKLNRAKNSSKTNNLRIRSLDLNLPRIKEDNQNQDLNNLIPSSNKKLRLPLLGNQANSKELEIYDSKNKLKQNLRYRMQSRNKYKHLTSEYKDIHKSYIAKDEKSLSKRNKLKPQMIIKAANLPESPSKGGKAEATKLPQSYLKTLENTE